MYDELIETISLKIIQITTNKINHKILKMLPSDINTIMKELNLTKVPVNIRINQLEKIDLVNRFKGTGEARLTEFGKFMLDELNNYSIQFIKPRILKTIKELNKQNQ